MRICLQVGGHICLSLPFCHVNSLVRLVQQSKMDQQTVVDFLSLSPPISQPLTPPHVGFASAGSIPSYSTGYNHVNYVAVQL